jgi:hypothetical protein
VGNTYNINSNYILGRSCADAVAYNVTSLESYVAVVDANGISSCLSAGDEILLINLQGTSTSTYNTGTFEFLRVDSIIDNGTANDTVVFTTHKIRWYGDSWRTDDNIGTGGGQQKVMLMRVPNFNNVTVNGTLTANAWNGLKYGVIAYRVKGTLLGEIINGKIDVATKGFPGGAGGDSYFTDSWHDDNGDNGVGIGKAYTGGGSGTYGNCAIARGSGGGYGGNDLWNEYVGVFVPRLRGRRRGGDQSR